ncbi:hypothetical protein HOY80DRAFT_1140606 [Tuber brumale]|nr:hypothetical protein HOY80DRAFT_1140606 [Tuber brumale]
MKITLPLLTLLASGATAAVVQHSPSFMYRDSPHHHLREQEYTSQDYELRCPKSRDPHKMTLPAITQEVDSKGKATNILQCWEIDNVVPAVEGIEGASLVGWGAFDAAYQYDFHEGFFMPPHPAPEPSLVLMSAGVGLITVPSGEVLRLGPGDTFFSVGTDGWQTAWWSEGTRVTDFYFKDGEVPNHATVQKLTH